MKSKRCEYRSCNKLISNNIAWYSLRMYGEELCMDHQNIFKLQKFNKNLIKYEHTNN